MLVDEDHIDRVAREEEESLDCANPPDCVSSFLDFSLHNLFDPPTHSLILLLDTSASRAPPHTLSIHLLIHYTIHYMQYFPVFIRSKTHLYT